MQAVAFGSSEYHIAMFQLLSKQAIDREDRGHVRIAAKLRDAAMEHADKLGPLDYQEALAGSTSDFHWLDAA